MTIYILNPSDEPDDIELEDVPEARFEVVQNDDGCELEEGETVTLDGSVSKDPLGEGLEYEWRTNCPYEFDKHASSIEITLGSVQQVWLTVTDAKTSISKTTEVIYGN
ncbi:hypothetical protein [Haladaptatus cibarius]|uniref:hypothetical protein n=1 Tax=Haladaptatus cibarius TaxID=453847 RepID=UPI000678ED47|nr:hypothetical protein [Haladaptatus cibarius]